MTEPLRIGVLGAARISERAIVVPAHATGHRLVAVAARDVDRAHAFAEQHGFERVAASYDDLLNDREVELIYNPLVNSLHGPVNLAALRAGKHVLSEKPSASNTEEARLVREAAAGSKGRFVEAFHYLFHPLFRRMVELVSSGRVGDVQRTEVSLTMPDPGPSDPRWQLDLAGGSLMDLGCYSLHASRMLGARLSGLLGGEPRIVSAEAVERPGESGVDESMTVELAYPNGVSGTAHSSMAGATLDFHCRIVGTRGEVMAPSFIRPDLDDSITVTTAAGETTEYLGTRPSYTYQLEAVAAHVRDGVRIATDAVDAYRTMTMIDAAYAAAGLPPRPRATGVPLQRP